MSQALARFRAAVVEITGATEPRTDEQCPWLVGVIPARGKVAAKLVFAVDRNIDSRLWHAIVDAGKRSGLPIQGGQSATGREPFLIAVAPTKSYDAGRNDPIRLEQDMFRLALRAAGLERDRDGVHLPAAAPAAAKEEDVGEQAAPTP